MQRAVLLRQRPFLGVGEACKEAHSPHKQDGNKGKGGTCELSQKITEVASDVKSRINEKSQKPIKTPAPTVGSPVPNALLVVSVASTNNIVEKSKKKEQKCAKNQRRIARNQTAVRTLSEENLLKMDAASIGGGVGGPTGDTIC